MIQNLLAQDQELAKLWKEHLELDSKIEALSERRYLSAEEEVEIKRLKKMKLAGRDRIETILAEHRR
jgi:uncharacterized protein YdcH (DUF465 family)